VNNGLLSVTISDQSEMPAIDYLKHCVTRKDEITLTENYKNLQNVFSFLKQCDTMFLEVNYLCNSSIY